MTGADGMGFRRPGPVGAALACALALAGALLPAGAAHAEGAEGTPAERVIPVAPVDPATARGQIVLAIADWLDRRLGGGSQTLRLALDAPIHADERDRTVTVHLPGARLVDKSTLLLQWALGDLAIAVTPRSATAYDFETVLPPVIEHPEVRFTIGEGAVSGTWRSDLEIATKLDADARNILALETTGPAAGETVTLGALSVSDEMAEGDDGLWDGHTTLSLSDLNGEGLSLGGFEIAGTFEDVDRDLVLAMRRNFALFTDEEVGSELLTEALAPLVDAKWGRSDVKIALHDLVASGEDWGLIGDGAFTLGRLVWQTEFDDLGAHSNLATRIEIADPRLSGQGEVAIPADYVPQALTVDLALNRLPVRKIAEAVSRLAERSETNEPDRAMVEEVVFAHLDAADTSFEVREIHIVAPSYAFQAEGRFQVEPASVFGAIGRMDARIRGLSTLIELAAAQGDEGMLAALVLLQGLGTPAFEEGSDEPVHAYAIDLRRDGAVTVNGIPIDTLFQNDPAPQ